MSKKKNEDDTLAWILTIAILGVSFIIKGIIEVMVFIIKLIITIFKKIFHIENTTQKNKVSKKQSNITVGDAIEGVTEAIKKDKLSNKNNKNDGELEEEMDEYGLDEDEKEEIRSGDYVVENFDMDNWDEDNYYYDEDEDKLE